EDLERTTDLLLNYGELSKFNEEEHEQSEQEEEEGESNDDDWQVAGPRRTERSDQSDVDMNAFAREQEALLNQRQQERLQHLQFEEEERARQAEEEKAYLAQAQEASNHSLQDTEWDDHSENIRTIADLTALTPEEIEPFYYRNNYDINSTLVDIVQDFNANLESNLKSLKEKFISELPRNSKSKIPAGGRVQSLPNFSMTLKEKEIVQKRLKEASGKLAYQYDDDGEDAKQLRILLVTNPHLSGIYWEFYIKLLKFFAGAYYKAMTFGLYLVEHDGISKTLDASWKTNSGSTAPGSSSGVSNATSLRQKKNGYKDNKSPFVSSSDLFKAPAIIKSEVTAASSAKLVEALSNRTLEKGLDDDQIELQRGQLSQVSASGKIDLHRFIVPNAKITTQKVLKDWWAEEVRLREHHGILKAGHNAKYIEPLDIITGRGLHTEGVSKVKNAIGLLLKKENYAFEELVGRFRVHGVLKTILTLFKNKTMFPSSFNSVRNPCTSSLSCTSGVLSVILYSSSLISKVMEYCFSGTAESIFVSVILRISKAIDSILIPNSRSYSSTSGRFWSFCWSFSSLACINSARRDCSLSSNSSCCL
ncbi:hypothetical protein WICPIJ_007192, partial [Wickerhamomyces pijperi]